MRDWLLIAAVAAVFAFGWFLMGKLDVFLERNRQALAASDESRLRLGFANPLAADGLLEVLERYSEKRPDVSVCLLSGTEEQLLEGLSGHRLDVIFLPEGAALPDKMQYHSRKILLNPTPVVTRYGGLPVEPIAGKGLAQKMVWRQAGITPAAGSFLDGMNGGDAVPEPRRWK